MSTPIANHDKVRKVEIFISNVLRAGVVISFLVILAGMILTLAHHPDASTTSPEFHRLTQAETEVPTSFSDLFSGVLALKGRAVVMFGALLLITTPVIRVAISIFAFVYQRDRTYVIITSIVLVLLLASFVLGKVEG